MPTCIFTLPPLPPATSQPAVENCTHEHPTELIKRTLLQTSADLLTLDSKATFGKIQKSSPYIISLSTLCDRLYAGKLAPPALPSPQKKAHSRNKSNSSTSSTSSNNSAAQSLQHACITARTTKQPWDRPLEHFEDLYYALLAKIQDIHQMIYLRVNNGFVPPTDTIYAQGPTFAELHDALQGYWKDLNEPSFIKALDSAVRRSRVASLQSEISERLKSGVVDAFEAEELENHLYASTEDNEVPGIAWIGGWAPSMIGAWLKEKYRNILLLEKEAHVRRKVDRRRLRAERLAKQKEKEEFEAQQRWRREYEAECKRRNQEEMEKQQRCREKYEVERRKMESELMTLAFLRRAESVREYGRQLRESAGGSYLGLKNEVWTVYGRG